MVNADMRRAHKIGYLLLVHYVIILCCRLCTKNKNLGLDFYI